MGVEFIGFVNTREFSEIHPQKGAVLDTAYIETVAKAHEYAGFDRALRESQQGGKYRIEIPAAEGYGAEEKRNPMTGEVVIPANSDLVFEVDVLQFMSEADFQRFVAQQRALMQQQMQAQQQQQGGGAAPGGAPGAPE